MSAPTVPAPIITTAKLDRLGYFTQYASQPRCGRCGRHHRLWRTQARCRFPGAGSIRGEGRWAVVSCTGITVTLYETEAEAEQVAEFLDRTFCGHRCTGHHRVQALSCPSCEEVAA